ncbi:MAG: DUF502 domain-containing protein [Planctomycetota bacterium]|nr:DUF502 domain-containing protein [Planctomycetota bacterium]
MAQTKKKKKKQQKKSMTLFFLKGLGALLPIVLTIFIFVTLVGFARTYVTKPINNTIYWSLEGNTWGWNALAKLGIDPYGTKYLDPSLLPTEPTNLKLRYEQVGSKDESFQKVLADERRVNETFFRDLEDLYIDAEALRDSVSSVVHPAIGVLTSVLLVIWIGWIMTGFVGRRIFAKFDVLLSAVPGVRSIYPLTKQLVDFFVSDTELEFDTVVAVPYPNKYIRSLGFVTSQSLKTIREATGEDLVSIFIPSSPMPMTGYTIHVPKHLLVEIPISIDEALAITVSGGVLVPEHEYVGPGPTGSDEPIGDAMKAFNDDDDDDDDDDRKRDRYADDRARHEAAKREANEDDTLS